MDSAFSTSKVQSCCPQMWYSLCSNKLAVHLDNFQADMQVVQTISSVGLQPLNATRYIHFRFKEDILFQSVKLDDNFLTPYLVNSWNFTRRKFFFILVIISHSFQTFSSTFTSAYSPSPSSDIPSQAAASRYLLLVIYIPLEPRLTRLWVPPPSWILSSVDNIRDAENLCPIHSVRIPVSHQAADLLSHISQEDLYLQLL